MWWLVVLAGAVGVSGFILDARWAQHWSRVSLTRVGLGLAVILLAVALGGSLIGIEVQQPPEQRGIGVRVDGLKAPLRERGYDRGFTVSMAVQVQDCGEPVRVQVTLAPTAEFWIDNGEALPSPSRVRFAVPDDLASDVPVDAVMEHIEAWAEWALSRVAPGEGALHGKFNHPSVAPYLRAVQRQLSQVETLLT